MEVKIIIVLLAAAGLFSAYEWKIHEAKQEGIQQCKEQTNALALQAQAQYLAQKDQASHDYQLAQTRNVAAVANARADVDKLRNDLRNAPAADPAASSSSGTAAIGSVLVGVLSDLEACTAGAESASDGVRALKSAWPTSIGLGKLKLGALIRPLLPHSRITPESAVVVDTGRQEPADGDDN